MSYRRTNEPGPLEVESSTSGATGGGDLDEWDDDCEACSWCGGEPYLQECDDPIQCCKSICDGQWHGCDACQDTGLAKYQVMW